MHGQTQRVKRSPQLARKNVMSGPNGPGPGARGASASPAPPPPARSGPKVGTRFRRRPGRAPEAPARGPAPGPGCPAPGASHDRTGLHTPHSIIVFISTYTRIIIFSIFRARSFDFFSSENGTLPVCPLCTVDMTTTQGPSEHELNEDGFSWDEVQRVEWRPKSCEDHESEYFWFGFKQFKAFLRKHQHTSYGRIKGLWVEYRQEPYVVKRKARGGHQIAFRVV